MIELIESPLIVFYWLDLFSLASSMLFLFLAVYRLIEVHHGDRTRSQRNSPGEGRTEPGLRCG